MPRRSAGGAEPPPENAFRCRRAEPVFRADAAAAGFARTKMLSAIATGLLLLATSMGEAACRKALALGLDVSDSVDGAEFRLQLGGLAGALAHPEVQAAFLAIPQAPVRLFVFEWAGPGSQRRIIDWTAVESSADLARVAEVLRARPRFELSPSTGLGAAMLNGGVALSAQPDCRHHVLDISGDGKSNVGVLPREIGAGALPGVTVNGLVVGSGNGGNEDRRDAEIADVLAYYMTDVIRGPGAFVEVAGSFHDFEAAMKRKLLRELGSPAIAGLRIPPPSHQGRRPPPGALAGTPPARGANPTSP